MGKYSYLLEISSWKCFDLIVAFDQLNMSEGWFKQQENIYLIYYYGEADPCVIELTTCNKMRV